jgi:RimJ/RimL family protein N-acetyltransferase
VRHTTAAQRATLKRLDRTAGQRRRYTSQYRGASIVRQFRLYFQHEDADHIGHALYEFLTLKVPGVEARSGLIPPDGGFRHHYAQPAALLADVMPLRHMLEARLEAADPDTVYSDGEDDVSVLRQILAIADDSLERVVRAAVERARESDLATARQLAANHGYSLVPITPSRGAQHQPEPEFPLAVRAMREDEHQLVDEWADDARARRWLGGPGLSRVEDADTPALRQHNLIAVDAAGRPVAFITWALAFGAPRQIVLLVAPSARRHGVGGAALRELVKNEQDEDEPVRWGAEVHLRNRVARRCLQSAGFAEVDRDGEHVIYELNA